MSLFSGLCPAKIQYSFSQECDGKSTLDKKFTLQYGKGCNSSVTATSAVVADLDQNTGQMKIFTSKMGNDTFEECFVYHETGKAFVFRRCLVGYLQDGKACAAIFAKTSEKCPSDGLVNFIANMSVSVDFLQTSVDCFDLLVE